MGRVLKTAAFFVLTGLISAQKSPDSKSFVEQLARADQAWLEKDYKAAQSIVGACARRLEASKPNARDVWQEIGVRAARFSMGEVGVRAWGRIRTSLSRPFIL